MVESVLKNTFLSTYKDDFRDSDQYYRVLFNSGRALQARELTQMQTIIQREVERFGRYIFKDNSLLSSSLGSIYTNTLAVDYIKLSTNNGLPSGYDSLVNTIISNTGASGIVNPVKALVKAVIPGTPDVLLITYTDKGNNTAPFDAFRAGQNLTTDLGTLTVGSTAPVTGKGSMITTNPIDFFALGHFVFVPSQSLVIDKFNPSPTDVVGFRVQEKIITAADNIALYDNSGATPNLTSPGADRYKIELTLALKSSVNIATETFVELLKIDNGVVSAVQTQDTILSEVGNTLARRTKEESGNYVINTPGAFNLTVLDDSADEDYLVYEIQPGTGYVEGRRIEIPTATQLRVQKPRRVPSDYSTFANETVIAQYGNYFLADSMYGMVRLLDSASLVSFYPNTDLKNLSNPSDKTIGSARVRALDKVDSKYRIHVFDVRMDSNNSGTLFNINTVRSIGVDSANYANLTLDEGIVKLYNTENNSLLFPLPRQRTRDFTTSGITGGINITVADTFQATTNGSGEAVFTAAVDETFVDEEQWILAYDSGTVVTGLVADSGLGTKQIRITGLATGQDVRLLAFINTVGETGVKSLTSAVDSNLSLVDGVFTLSKADIFRVNSIIDDTTNEDITFKFAIDKGQRDNFYDVGSGRLKSVHSAPAGTFRVNYEYFLHTEKDFFSVNSYNVAYSDIPNYRLRDGNVYSLADVIDFRPTIDPATRTFGSGASVLRLPRNRDTMNIGTANHWKSRQDQIYLGADGIIKVAKQNISKNIDEQETVPLDAMLLHTVQLSPYTHDKNDLYSVKSDNRGYQMKDIRKIEKRVANLEDLTSLSLGELKTNNLTVIDADGLERSKLGITVDTFKDHSFSQSTKVGAINLQYRASIDRSEQTLRPQTIRRHLPLVYDSDASVGTVRKGDTIWPTYSETVLISQTDASGYENLNQFSLSRFRGTGIVKPSYDSYLITRTLKDGATTVVYNYGDLSTYDQFREYGVNIKLR